MHRAAILALAVLALSGCGSSTKGSSSNEQTVSNDTAAWVKRVAAQVRAWNTQYQAVQVDLRRRDFKSANATILKLGDSGRSVRSRFSDVPEGELADAQRIFRDMVAVGDAALAWAVSVRTDPPPFTGDPQAQLVKGRKLADRALAFRMAYVRLTRFLARTR